MPSRGVAVDGLSDELLAGAGLAAHADRDVAARHAGDEGEDLAHQRGVADDAFDGIAARRVAGARFLLDHAAQAMVLRTSVEERGERVTRLRRPIVDAIDKEELAIGASRPI